MRRSHRRLCAAHTAACGRVAVEACLRNQGLTPADLHVVHWAGLSKTEARRANPWPGDRTEQEARSRYAAEVCRWLKAVQPGANCSHGFPFAPVPARRGRRVER